jgi:DNA polymerase I-like protein with 3'-5' exonuclease and polymerase domains
MVRVDEIVEKEKAGERAYLLLQVHDELVYEIHDNLVSEMSIKIKEIMESVLSVEETGGVPISVTMKSGKDWGNMKPL